MGQFSEFDYAVGDYCRHLEADHNESFGCLSPYVFAYETGRKYVKIIMSRANGTAESSHSWVVIGDQGKFKHGDILFLPDLRVHGWPKSSIRSGTNVQV